MIPWAWAGGGELVSLPQQIADPAHSLVHALIALLGSKTVLIMLALGAVVMGRALWKKWS